MELGNKDDELAAELADQQLGLDGFNVALKALEEEIGDCRE